MRPEHLLVHDSLASFGPQNSEQIFWVDNSFTAEYTGNQFVSGKLAGLAQRSIIKFSLFQTADREWLGYKLAFANGVATAKPMALVSRITDEVRGVMTEYVSDESLDDDSPDDLFFRLGEEVYKLHGIVAPGYGYINADGPQFKNADDYTTFWLNKVLPYIEGDVQTYPLFRALYDSTNSRPVEPEARFLHRDLNLSNILLNNSQLHLIDFEWWQGGHPLDDIAVALYHFIRADKDMSKFYRFAEGYFGNLAKLSDPDRVLINFYLLFAASRVVSFCERLNPSKKAQAYEDLNLIVNYINSEDIFKR